MRSARPEAQGRQGQCRLTGPSGSFPAVEPDDSTLQLAGLPRIPRMTSWKDRESAGGSKRAAGNQQMVDDFHIRFPEDLFEMTGQPKVIPPGGQVSVVAMLNDDDPLSSGPNGQPEGRCVRKSLHPGRFALQSPCAEQLQGRIEKKDEEILGAKPDVRAKPNDIGSGVDANR